MIRLILLIEEREPGVVSFQGLNADENATHLEAKAANAVNDGITVAVSEMAKQHGTTQSLKIVSKTVEAKPRR